MVTDMIAKGEPDVTDAIANQPIARLGRADEIAASVLWLCSPGASSVVGVASPVNGGYTHIGPCPSQGKLEACGLRRSGFLTEQAPFCWRALAVPLTSRDSLLQTRCGVLEMTKKSIRIRTQLSRG
jgi:hypothetical protein